MELSKVAVRSVCPFGTAVADCCTVGVCEISATATAPPTSASPSGDWNDARLGLGASS